MSNKKENLTPDPTGKTMIMGSVVQFINTDGETKQVNCTTYEAAAAFCKKNGLTA